MEDCGESRIQTKIFSHPIDEPCFLYSIRGFTSWSSGRQPSDVFRLLETLYSEFDKTAKRRGVYKVSISLENFRKSLASPLNQLLSQHAGGNGRRLLCGFLWMSLSKR